MRIMAIDYGDAHTGIAISDPTGLLAGFTTVINAYRPDRVTGQIALLAKEHRVERLVLGHPINMDGTRGPRSEKAQAMRQLLEETGVTYLSNTFVPLERNGDTITLAGIDDPNGYAGQKSPEEVAGEVKEAAGDGFWLLMAHRNNLFDGEYCRLGADLVLSGHGHGGIWRLPFTDGLLGAGGQLLPSFTNGFYRCTDGHEAQVFVTRGLGGIPRLFNHPQVAVLTLHCE